VHGHDHVGRASDVFVGERHSLAPLQPFLDELEDSDEAVAEVFGFEYWLALLGPRAV
jgi:hypothetical protein